MDTHLTTIGSTLDAIARIHASAPSSSRNVYRPFTCAVLNTYKLDVLDYIRDADQVESNLFWYPPPPGGNNGKKGESEQLEGTIAPGAATRLPEPKEIVPPTPLRKNVIEAEAKGLVQFDARTLLKAAQRLLDNYHHAPRARKHIKALLKRNNEIEKQLSQYDASIATSESLINKLSHSEYRKELAASFSGQSSLSTDPSEEIHKLQDSIKRERMEIMAIEQMTESLLEKHQKVLSQKARSQTDKAIGKSRVSTTQTSASPSLRSGSVTPKPRAPTEEPMVDRRDVTINCRSSETPDANQSQLNTEAQASPGGDKSVNSVDSEEVEKEEEGEEEDVTVRRSSGSVEVVESEDPLASTEPEASDELERICENIWTLFGDNLRYVAVDRESADYRETLRFLQTLSLGGTSVGGEGDLSMASSSNDSQTTAATSGSTSSSTGQLENAGPPSSTTAIAAHVLSILLTTPPPHVMEFEELKAAGETWWNSHGLESLKKSTMGREAPSDITDSSSVLASKAVYSLIAKKLLRLQIRVGKRMIFFPAHIV